LFGVCDAIRDVIQNYVVPVISVSTPLIR